MNDLTCLISHYTIKYDRLLRKICAPLNDYLSIPIFSYYTIKSDGQFGLLSNYPEQVDFYFREKLYVSYPYFKHPLLLRSGCTFTEATPDPHYLELSDKKYQLRNLFVILRRKQNDLEGFMFANRSNEEGGCRHFFNHLDLLNQFASHFKHEAHSLIEEMHEDGYNLKQAKGAAFYESHASLPLASNDREEQRFIKAISPLTKRERQCLEMFKGGHTAQSTAALLGLSQRTVEHYFESIKNKLGLRSKSELLEF